MHYKKYLILCKDIISDLFYNILCLTNAVENGELAYLYKADANGVKVGTMPIASTRVSNNTYQFSLVKNGKYIVEIGGITANVTVADSNVTADITK